LAKRKFIFEKLFDFVKLFAQFIGSKSPTDSLTVPLFSATNEQDQHKEEKSAKTQD